MDKKFINEQYSILFDDIDQLWRLGQSVLSSFFFLYGFDMQFFSFFIVFWQFKDLRTIPFYMGLSFSFKNKRYQMLTKTSLFKSFLFLHFQSKLANFDHRTPQKQICQILFGPGFKLAPGLSPNQNRMKFRILLKAPRISQVWTTKVDLSETYETPGAFNNVQN